MLLEYALIEKNFDQCQIEMNFPFIFCIVMYYAVNYLYWCLIWSILIQEAIVIRFQ